MPSIGAFIKYVRREGEGDTCKNGRSEEGRVDKYCGSASITNKGGEDLKPENLADLLNGSLYIKFALTCSSFLMRGQLTSMVTVS